MIIVGQIFTTISYLIYYISRFRKKKKDILIMDNISKFFTVLSFVFLKSYDGVSATVYTYIRNKVHNMVVGNKKRVIYAFWLLLFALIIMLGIKFNGIGTVCVFITMIANLIGVMFLNSQGMRVCTMCGSIFYVIFQITIQNYAGAIGESLTFVVNGVSFSLYFKKGEKIGVYEQGNRSEIKKDT